MEKLIISVCCATAAFLSPIVSAATLSSAREPVSSPVEKSGLNKQAFYTQFLGRAGDSYDLEGLSAGELKPGHYFLTLYVNDRKLSGEKILFAQKEGAVVPCMDMNLLLLASIDSQFIDHNLLAGSCVGIADVIAGATAEYNDEESTLSLTIPQKYLMYANKDYINPDLWDDGVTAFRMTTSSNLSSFNARNQPSQHTFYTGMQTSLNVGAWRINSRDNIYLSNLKDNSFDKFTHNELYAYRAIRSLQSKFSVGNIFTSGDFFDSTSLTGVTLQTNDQMLPFSMRSYLPRIQGIAESNATVTLVQGGSVIYETQVPPGEFVLNDFYPGSGGDIQVNVRESDGRTTSFTVPYSSVPQLLRQGYQRYALTVGEVRNHSASYSPLLVEGTWQYGIGNDLTSYAGMQLTDTDYQALLIGSALNTPAGAFSSDLTRTFYHPEKRGAEHCSGFCATALQLNYNKLFDDTGTGINASLKEALGKGYIPLADTLSDALNHSALRTRLDLNLSQSLPENWGGVYVGGMLSRYWGRPPEWTWQASYRNSYNTLNYSLSFLQRDDYRGKKDRQVYLNFSFPLWNDANKRAALLASGGYNSSGATLRTAISGVAGEQQQYGFNTYVNTRRGGEFNGGASFTHTSDALTSNASISQTGSGTSYGLGLNSGVLIHAGGINFSHGMSDSIALVHAPAAEGTRIRPDQRARIQSNSFGILRSLVPYQYNEIYLDPQGSGFGVDISDSHTSIVPTEGAIVLHRVESKNNPVKLFHIIYPDGKIPFGTQIKDAAGKIVGMTGQNSSVILPVTESETLYSLSWREGETIKSCTAMSGNVQNGSAADNFAIATIDCIPSPGDKND